MVGPLKAVDIPESAEAILFDCDGTLVDSMPLHWDTWHQTLRTYDVECDTDFLYQQAGSPTEKIIRDINLRYRRSIDAEEFTLKKEELFYAEIAKVEEIEIIASIARNNHGQRKMAVVSGGIRKNVVGCLKQTNLLHLFEVIVTADDDVSPKPAPDVFLAAAKQLQVEPQACHVFEDADLGIRAAQAARMSYTDVRPLLQSA